VNLSRLAWALFGLSVALSVTALVFLAGTPKELRSDSVASGESLLLESLFVSVMMVIAATGALVASRRSGNIIGWLLVGTGVSTGAYEVLFWYGRYAIGRSDPLSGGAATASIAQAIDWLGPSTIILLFLLFPTGRAPSPRWTALLWIWAAWLVAATGLSILTPGPLFYLPSIENPFGIEQAGFLTESRVQYGASVGWVALQVASIVALGTRFRGARGIERQQLKWFLYSAALLVLAFVAAVTETVVSGEESTGSAAAVISLFVYAGIVGLAISTGLAILRYRLYDIDVVINRTLVYGSVTALLAASYLGLVLLFQLAFQPVTEGSGLAVALSTLAVAALFRPARNRVQGLVDRRFYRERYDAQRTLEGFAARLRDEVDLDSLRAELTGVVAQTMQPDHVSLWLKEAR
jgi:hypothetical protein